MKEYDIKELLKSDTVVNCKNRKQTKKYLEYLQSQGYSWEAGNKPISLLFYFDKYLNKTCFRLTPYKTIRYASASYYKSMGYKILSLKDITIKR